MPWSCSPGAATLLGTYQSAGVLFHDTLRTLLAAQCALVHPEQWPRDRTDSVLAEPEFDFVVVGAGAAGSVVASRLSEVPQWKVLLVEAGGDPNLNTEVPGFFFNNVNTSHDWGYRVQPQDKACLGYKDRRCSWPRAKILGGCTSINAMFYIRGNSRDYDEWEEAGNTGWGYEQVLAYFKKSQDIQGGKIDEENLSKYHRKGGYLHTEINDIEDPLEELLIQANVELGTPLSYDFNGKSQIGVGRGFSTIKNKRRMSTARAFLSPIRNRENLYTMKNSIATKLIFHNNSNRVNSLLIRKNGVDITVKVTKEIIVSGGAINSPQLLLLSGIGRKKDLQKLGIDLKKDLPVGYNLQDHLHVPIFYTMNSVDATFEDISKFFHDYLMTRTGPLSSMSPCRIANFINTDDFKSKVPNVQHHYVIYDYIVNDYYGKHQFSEDISKQIKDLNKNKTIITVYNVLLRPKSRGQVKLETRDPMDHPLIYANYFENPKDMDTLIAGIRYAMKLQHTKAFKKMGIQLEWINLKHCNHLDSESDEFLKCWAREMTTTLYHPTSTVKMGSEDDDEAVVNSKLQVHGVDGLRVIDASIMPNIVRGNTQAPTIMIGEKGSDMIKAKWIKEKDEL